MVSSWILSEEWRTQPSQSRLSLIKARAVRYPTVLVCNPLHYFNLASKSSCHDELGPWNANGQDTPSKDENKTQTCVPVGRIVFYTPVGPQYCLKYQAPDDWKDDLTRGTSIIKAMVQLLGPHGEEHFFPADSAVIYVIDTPGWEEAVDKYQTQRKKGNSTEFDSLFNAISAESSIVVAAAQHHTNVIVHTQKWVFQNGTSKYRYHVTSSHRPLNPTLFQSLNMNHEHVLALRIMFGSEEVAVVEEQGPMDWQRIFGFVAALAALLDISSRFTHFVIKMLWKHGGCTMPVSGQVQVATHELDDDSD